MEYTTLEWVRWFNNRRLVFEWIGPIPPAEFDKAYYTEREGFAAAAGPA